MKNYKQLLFKTKHFTRTLFVAISILTAGISILIFVSRHLVPQVGERSEFSQQAQGSYEDYLLRSANRISSIEFTSNLLLVKFKPDIANTLYKDVPGFKTGRKSLDDIAQKANVKDIRPLVRSAKQPSARKEKIDQWFLVTLDIPQRIISLSKDNFSSLDGLLKEVSGDPALRVYLNAFALYQNDSAVEAVEQDVVVHSFEVPNDYYFSSEGNELWNLHRIDTEEAWDVSHDSDKKTIVAIADSGVDYNHSDLAANVWTNHNDPIGDTPDDCDRTAYPWIDVSDDDCNGYIDDYRGWDFVNLDNDPMDDDGHGTHIAGIIAAVGNNDWDHSVDNGTRLVGVNWTADMMPLKVLDSNGRGSLSGILSALQYAADMGAGVLNMSWGAPGTSQALDDVLEYAAESGVVLVAAAGNSSGSAMMFTPANSPLVITVSASGMQDQGACFTSRGSKIDVAAPGGDSANCGGNDETILSAGIGGGYASMRGTSMAAPHVTGVVALLKSLHPGFSAEEIRQILRQSADDVTGKEWDWTLGYGRLNAAKTLDRKSFIPPPPVARIFSPGHDSTLGQQTNLTVMGTASSRVARLPVYYQIFLGEGVSPNVWDLVAEGNGSVQSDRLATVDLSGFTVAGDYTIKIVVKDIFGGLGEDRVVFYYDGEMLPGWPKRFGGIGGGVSYAGPPAIADLNGDGKLDFIVTGTFDKRVYAWQIDGTSVPGWPADLSSQFDGWQFAAPPAVSDLDGDGKPEVVVNTSDTSGIHKLFVFRSDGTLYPGSWPKRHKEFTFNIPALADINGDGNKDIVLNDCGIRIFSITSDSLPGWPYLSPNVCFNNFFENPTIIDLENDGSAEIIQYLWQLEGRLYVFNSDGTLRFQDQSYAPGYTNPAVGDLDGDGIFEIVFKGYSEGSNTIIVLRADGSLFPGFPKSIPGNLLSTGDPAIADLDADGRPEIIFPGQDKVRVYDATGTELTSWHIPVTIQFDSPTIADIDGDARSEILVGGFSAPTGAGPVDGLYIAKENAGAIWQKNYGWAESSPIAGDFDNDGNIEVAGAMNDGAGYKFYVWRLPYKVVRQERAFSFWSQFQFDERHTGSFAGPVLAGEVITDTDNDGFSDAIENYLGTDPNKACPATSIPDDEDFDPWPPDFNDDGIVQIDDVTRVSSRFGAKVGDANYSPRYELASQNGIIQIDDVSKVSGLFGKSCLPFGKLRARPE